MLPQKLAFVDIETTGMSFLHDRIIEIGILRVEDNKLVETYQTFLDPQVSLPPEIEMLTGIVGKQLESAPTFWQVKDEISRLLGDCVVVAHNARFDYGFLKSEYKRVGEKLENKNLCTVKLFRNLFPGLRRYGLDSLIEQFGFQIESRHRAFDDAKILWDFYQKALEEQGEEKLSKAIKQVTKRPKFPVKLDPKVIDNLSEEPGVYIFYGEKGSPLYVGKSVNLHDRVLSHFSSDDPKEIAISQQIESMETIETAGELGALLKELEMIQKLQPLYQRKLNSFSCEAEPRNNHGHAPMGLHNRLSRQARKLTIAETVEGESDYWTVHIREVEKLDPQKLDRVVGVYRNRRQAQETLRDLADQHELCPKILGLDHSTTSCFSYHLGKCRGACLGKEPVEKYNARFALACSGRQFKSWPFKGTVVITERIGDKEDNFLVNNWCYMGLLDNEGTSFGFDVNVYKVLTRFLLTPGNQKKIHLLN